MNQLVTLLLAAAPSVNSMAAYMASVPSEIMTMVQSDGCTLPEDFTILNFSGTSEDDGETLDTLEFGFQDDNTGVTTMCYFNETSEPIVDGGRSPRFPCADGRVLFIQREERLTMIEKVCPGDDGTADYEAAGTVLVDFSCGDEEVEGVDAFADDECVAAEQEVTERFSSISPVPDVPGNSTARF